MSKNTKIIMWAVIVIAIIILAWWYVQSMGQSTQTTSTYLQTQTQTQPNTPAVIGTSPGDAIAPVAPVSGPTTSSKDSSDAALNSDMSNIDSQNSGLQGDSSNVDQGMKATTQ